MDKAEFDQFADEYYDQHRQNIAISGEGPEYFAEYKIKKLKRIADGSQLAVSQICDFGSGIGNSIPYFRRYFPNARLTLADISERSLAVSQDRFPGSGNFLLIEDDRLPVDDNRFDLTFSACVFHHIPRRERMLWLRELLRVTKIGGLLAIFEHNPLNPLTVHAVNTCPFDENAQLILAKELMGGLTAAGAASPSVQYSLFFPRGLALFRPLEPYLSWLPIGAQYVAIARKL